MQSQKLFYPNVNFLRGVSALMVCIIHFFMHSDHNGDLFSPEHPLRSGFSSMSDVVFAFFVISGFVIPISLYNSRYRLQNLGTYMLRRLTRVNVPYVASMVLILLAAFAFAMKNGEAFSLDWERIGWHLTFLVSFTEFEWYNEIYWTIAIEVQFYLLIGLFFPLISSRKVLAHISMAALLALSFWLVDNRQVLSYNSIFMFGLVLFMFETRKFSKEETAIWLAVLTGSVIFLHGWPVALVCVLTILGIKFFTWRNKVTDFIGDISYSIYLTHGLIGGNVLYLLGRYIDSTLPKLGLMVFALLASILFAALFYRFTEKPSLRWARRFSWTRKVKEKQPEQVPVS